MQQLFFLTMALLISTAANAQSPNEQIVHGTITDKVSEQPLIGANIILQNSNPVVGASTNEKGNFEMKVPLGRQTFIVQYVGYKSFTVPEILVTAGKQVQLDVSMEEQATTIKDVVVSATSQKDRPNNEFSAVSARTFSMEEVTRYSGGRNDVGRLVTNFAGVSTSNDSRNDIVVRGNSPSGVLWRLEGVPIPNPNHFATLGTSGGPVSAVNTNLLRNSDFMTGAFAAEYGNANSSVFDLGFRSGNTQKHEFMFQLGAFSGFELMGEGPINKAKTGSYVVAARYSFAGIGAALHIPIGTAAAPHYTDLSFKIDLPQTKKSGKFSLFGIGAYSFIDFIGKKLTTEDLFADPYSDRYPRSAFGVVGLRHSIAVGEKAYVKTTISASFEHARYDQYDYPDSVNRLLVVKNRDYTGSLRINSFYNRKFSARLSMRAGATIEAFYSSNMLRSRTQTPDWIDVRNHQGMLALIQPYAQIQYKVAEKLTINAGLHTSYLSLNNSWSIEPRASLSYHILPTQTISLAYGWHSQNQPLPVYFYKAQNADGSYDNSNRNLDFTRAHHVVLAYDVKFAKDWRIKLEPYIQFITNAPVERTASSFSMLNAGADFVYPDRGYLVNKGIGRNMGVELTLEKFFSHGYYGLLTASVFDSKYKGSDNIWRNTTFNNRYVVNFLAGKEFRVGKDKRHALTTDLKFTTSGGRWYTPVDLIASKAAGTEVLDNSQAFSKQYKYYLRLDLKLGFRLNSKKKKISNAFFVDLQNLTFQKNIFESRYNPRTQHIDNVYQIGFFPDLMYRITF
ncbi:MAG: TonB-dependent receptor [Chitinophagales bacterium]